MLPRHHLRQREDMAPKYVNVLIDGIPIGSPLLHHGIRIEGVPEHDNVDGQAHRPGWSSCRDAATIRAWGAIYSSDSGSIAPTKPLNRFLVPLLPEPQLEKDITKKLLEAKAK